MEEIISRADYIRYSLIQNFDLANNINEESIKALNMALTEIEKSIGIRR